MIRTPPRVTRTDTLIPSTTLVRSEKACWCRQYQRLPTGDSPPDRRCRFSLGRGRAARRCPKGVAPHDDILPVELFLHREEAGPQGLRQARLDPRSAVPARDPGRFLTRITAAQHGPARKTVVEGRRGSESGDHGG